ncbi:uncharacterized protein N7496_003703 [Penicillium cataractarum]|uniref:SNF2 family helicase/ATPase n=1 Tax=Penicillium cataractarum TaxID=2100454 RepID=A0A9W9SMP7_9EURO|nr:uncharacterized protein N7496_003703 [Penicillium cataractarum]KAJ5381275.1 hypothetical protein N7496_003703 [Penicillium cataractarum]
MDAQSPDPVDWGVDAMVNFLCNPQEAPWANSATSSRPNLTALETALRDNQINGEALLHDVDREALRDDLGIKPLGHRSSVLRAIDWLRVRSPKYQTSKWNSPSSNQPLITEEIVSPVKSPPIATSVDAFPHFASVAPKMTPAPAVAGMTEPEQTIKPNSSSSIRPHSPEHHLTERFSPCGNSRSITTPVDASSQAPPATMPAPETTGMKAKRRIAPTLVTDPKEQLVGQGFDLMEDVSLDNQSSDLSSHPVLDRIKNYSTEVAGDGGNGEGSVPEPSRAKIVAPSTPTLESHLSADRSYQLSGNDYDFLAQLLENYPPEPVGKEDDILPLYGESDVEYDEETQQEIDDEESDFMVGLSWAECHAIISEYIANYETTWNENQLPKHRHYAQVVWQGARNARTGKTYKPRVLRSLTGFLLRLETHKKALIKVKYRSKTAFLAGCKIMDPTLDQICFEKWRLETIELDTCPPFVPPPPRVSRPRKRRTVDEDADEESLGSESEISADEEASGNEASADESDSGFPGDIPNRPQRALLGPTPRETDLVAPGSDESEEGFVANKRRRLMGSQDHEEANNHISPSQVGPFAGIEDREPCPISSLDHVSPSTAFQFDSSPQALHESDVADEMMVETPPLNPTLPASSPRDVDMEDDFLVKTPPLNPTNLPQPTLKLKLTLSSPEPPFGNAAKNTALCPLPQKTSSRSVSLEKESGDITSPNMDDIDIFDEMVHMSWHEVESSGNRIWLLAKHLTCLPRDENKSFGPYMEELIDPVYMEEVTAALQAMLKNQWHLEGRTDDESKSAMCLGAFFVSWHSCKMLTARGMGKETLQRALEALEDDEGLKMFIPFLHRLKTLYTSKGEEEIRKRRRSKPMGPRPLSNMQKDAQERQAKQDQARERLRKERESKGLSNSDPEGQAVTFKDPVIYLHPQLGRYVKPHQLTGIQFMWRELIEANNQQGCLLAHVMGLGKSMQVISLLVTIAAAANSDNPEISKQVPERFHRSQTLVLCPSSVVQNWMDEFAMWTPYENHLGPVREITPRGRNFELPERLKTIREWDRNGGVLIMSYEMLRILIVNKPVRLDAEEHELVQHCLLARSNIIVADEAHKLRSANSAISQVASRFKSTSRIAMTGSPLSNQLSEYYQMVEWVAPGYLEDPATFKRKFMEPIQAGSYIDSTRSEQRESLVSLQLLNGILAPKVLRADTSVLAADLPVKTEFVLTVPLTELQRNAYDTFVDCARAGSADASLKLWSWLAIMQLCCNHPYPFREKLADRLKQQEENEGPSVLPRSIQDAGLPSELVSQMEALFSKYYDLQDIALSNRAVLLDKILDLSIKAGDKILIFTQSIPTMNYLDLMLKRRGRKYQRIDGSTPGVDRQVATKLFNQNSGEHILLISTRAGGVGLNMFGANRVVIFDFLFNPMWEEQAVGRAYRLGQKKPVYVYRFVAGGTFEELIFNNAVFKRQLAVRVVDKKTVVRESSRKPSTYLTHVKDVARDEEYDARGRDPQVLDKLLGGEYCEIILKATLSHIQDNENDHLTEEESRQVEDELKLERLKRSDPLAYSAEMKRRDDAEKARQQQVARLNGDKTWNTYVQQMEQARQQQSVTMQPQHLASLNRGPVPRPVASKSPLSVNNKGASQPTPVLTGANSTMVAPHQLQIRSYQPSSSSFVPSTPTEQTMPSSTYAPSSSSLRQDNGGDTQLAYVVPPGNEVIVIDDDSTHSTPVKGPANPSHRSAIPAADISPASPTPNIRSDVAQANTNQPTTTAQEVPQAATEPSQTATLDLGGDGSVDPIDKNTAGTGHDQVTEPRPAVADRETPLDASNNGIMDLETIGSKKGAVDTALETSATPPGMFSESEAMDISDGA